MFWFSFQGVYECVWNIEAPRNQNIRLIFNSFASSAKKETGCPKSHIQIYDGAAQTDGTDAAGVVDLGRYTLPDSSPFSFPLYLFTELLLFYFHLYSGTTAGWDTRRTVVKTVSYARQGKMEHQSLKHDTSFHFGRSTVLSICWKTKSGQTDKASFVHLFFSGFVEIFAQRVQLYLAPTWSLSSTVLWTKYTVTFYSKPPSLSRMQGLHQRLWKMV